MGERCAFRKQGLAVFRGAGEKVPRSARAVGGYKKGSGATQGGKGTFFGRAGGSAEERGEEVRFLGAGVGGFRGSRGESAEERGGRCG